MKPEDNLNILPPRDEIDVIDLVKILWSGHKIIISCLVVFASIGLFVAFTSPNVYTASTIMVPQVQSKSGMSSGLGGLAALAGINLSDMGSGSSDLSPSLYPEIIKSYPFQKELIYVPLKWNSLDKEISIVEYSKRYSKPGALSIIKKYTIGLPGVLLSLFPKDKGKIEVAEKRNDSIFSITPNERALCDGLSNTLTLKVDNKNGYIVLTAMGPEPIMTAQLADKAQRLLRARITEYRINKAQQNLTFIQDRYNEKKKEFEATQDKLARFRDRNLNMASNMAKTEEERLQSEYQLAFTIYSELAKQLESSKIKIKEDTPVFSIIQPVSVPVIRTKPNKPSIIVLWIVFGGLVGVGWLFSKNFIQELREKWINHEANLVE